MLVNSECGCGLSGINSNGQEPTYKKIKKNEIVPQLLVIEKTKNMTQYRTNKLLYNLESYLQGISKFSVFFYDLVKNVVMGAICLNCTWMACHRTTKI